VPEDVKWQLLEDLVRQIATRQALVLVSVPRKEDVAAGNTDFTRRLQQLGQHLAIDVVDLQPALRPEYFYRSDIHWNATGHRVVAAQLAARILPRSSAEAPTPAHEPAGR